MKWVKVLALLLAFAVDRRAQAQTAATVTWTTTYQTIDGFGASNANNWTVANSYDSTFFNTLGFSLLRVAVNSDGSCTSVNQACALNDGSESSHSSPVDAQACVAVSGCRVWATSWGPPGIYSTNGSPDCSAGSGNGTLSSSHYQDYATYLSNYIASMSQYYGVNIFALSVQNEPDQCTSYTSSLWSAALYDTFITPYLVPTLATNGQSSVKILMPESSQWSSFTTYASACMGDSSCANSIYANTFHDYDLSGSISQPYSTPYWETEFWGSQGGSQNEVAWDPSITDALSHALRIHYLMTVGVSAYHWWNLMVNPTDPNQSNTGLIAPAQSTPIAARAYVIGQWSNFVRPGMVRVGATANPQTGVYVDAYKNTSSGAFAIVAINTNTSGTSQAFSFSGFTASSVSPYITDSSLNLAQQGNVSVTGGNSFSYTLPAQSVTTFVGTNSGSNTAGVNPPTGLTLIVR